MLLTRRRFVAASSAFPLAIRSLAQGMGSPRWVFLGTDTGAGIFRVPWDARSGTLGKPVLAAPAVRPTFLALHPSLPVLYSVNEGSGQEAALSAFAVDVSSGTLTPINSLQTHGDAPCFVSVDRTGHAAYTANYAGGSLTAFQLGAGGRLTEAVGVLRYNQPQHGPVADRQEAAHLHCAVLSPDNRSLVVCDLGDDVLLVFPVNPEQGASVQTPLRSPARPGAGPRHVAFHPNGRWLYCINELDCTVTLYDWSVSAGQPTLTPRADAVVSTLLPGRAPAGDSAAEILVSDNGRIVYTCTRGADNMVAFRVDARSGRLEEQQRLPCGGKIPRLIAFDPSRRWLLSMNQSSSTVSVFAHDAATGRLETTPRVFAADTPMCAVWV